MKLFLWKDGAHYEGSPALVIVAADVGQAEAQYREYMPPLTSLPAPDRTYEIDPYSKEEVFIFPSGCCS